LEESVQTTTATISLVTLIVGDGQRGGEPGSILILT
jgi:hypothetical protein